MAQLTIEGDDLVVGLSALEKFGALMFSDVRVPLSAVRQIRSSTDPWGDLRGIRAPGTGIPGVLSLCIRRGTFGRDFAAVYRGRPAVVVELEGSGWQRLVISTADPDALVNAVRSRVGLVTN